MRKSVISVLLEFSLRSLSGGFCFCLFFARGDGRQKNNKQDLIFETNHNPVSEAEVRFEMVVKTRAFLSVLTNLICAFVYAVCGIDMLSLLAGTQNRGVHSFKPFPHFCVNTHNVRE